MNRISELRKSHGISQQEFAKQLGIAQNTLSQYENEHRTPPPAIIKYIASFFDVTINYVVGYNEQKSEESALPPDFSLQNVTKIITLDSTDKGFKDKLNLYLELGWKLLHIGSESEIGYDGAGWSNVLYTIGWYGKADEAKELPMEAPGEEHNRVYGWADDDENDPIDK